MICALPFFRFFILLLCGLSVLRAVDVPHQAYVWQRQWTPRLIDSIQAHAAELDGLTVLVAELSPSADGGSVVRVPVDYEALRATSLPISVAIRVGNYRGPFDADQPMTRRLLSEVRVALDQARATGVVAAAVEIDFDCATRQLEGYAEWLRALRPVLGEVPLSVTTLPTWMTRPQAFGELVGLTDHFVLQVHSVKRPDSIESNVMLCDPDDALRWAKEASAFSVPYHIALPTYGYRVGFDQAGALVKVSGENAPLIDDPELRYRVIRAEPVALSEVVRALHNELPDHCEGVIWYRLPIGRERLNWDAVTWRAVMAGHVGQSSWQVQGVAQSDGLIEIQIEQRSLLAMEPPQQVTVEWADAAVIAWDGQRNYSVKTEPDHALTFQWPDTMAAPLLPQGTRWTIGWLRMDAEAALHFTLIP
ncbi:MULTISPECIES: DUF3142 domain-containing protein [unclassified Lentimonas]|uniref:DUF3142 domain-containing protein n=1 Tax=unclassified Lentimonas TaxID=2630993 RepID=UPI00132BBDE9|nr:MULTISPECIES: DUF3142 domain-containing protein [unclassified Lentimonas]CAA6689924.1 Unannotated [Lentimonas sp. CC10]CAA6690976.1 Unannotated [Lentimonas sp. CC19]CAA7069384.1 Unannotated [Lentimonas sp. CC11]